MLSPWHADHVAGNAVFADCEILAHVTTAQALHKHRTELENGTPPIDPVVMPSRLYDNDVALSVGAIAVELRHRDVHSHDATVLLLPQSGLLFAGDALEDPITYVAEPEGLARHLHDLARMQAWPIERILPNHGAPDIIAAGGYGRGLLTATQRYIERLLECRRHRERPDLALDDLMAAEIAAGWIVPFAPYEAVHRRNLQMIRGLDRTG